ncbi:hypothetical protein [Rhodopila sp.]|jgi:hypothetical protein|uniref:hypothetical protein n=1 Tax=Rhodopila sp. TaxID=2480087 RepID=UPI002B94804D|nr:hypothetical protein [Rhodopila sp.]HVZ09782.1 hypothetical protein [Rhodopila sp.]
MTVQAVNGELMVTCSYETFIEMIRCAISGITVDDAWYRTRYPDIADAIDKGLVASSQKHFVDDGYFEGRQPFDIRVEEAWYLKQNPGVADYVRRGLLESGQQHFEENGYKEGRLPFPM